MTVMPPEAWEGAREWWHDQSSTYFWKDPKDDTVKSRPYTPSETADALARVNESTIAGRVQQAIQDNKDFLAIPAPTNAQVVAQVKALTRQANGVLRAVFKRLDASD